MPKPNILVLHTDQQRFDTIAALGASHLRTPNLDRLAARGTAFTRAYSANPVCMPARHDLITGVSARHHGYYHNQHAPIANYGLPTLPRLLGHAGYQTIAVGKMHYYPPRMHHGFSHMYLMEELPGAREDDAYLQYLQSAGLGDVRCQHGVRPLFYHTPQISRVPEEHHGSSWVAHQTIDLLRRDRDRPLFLFASWVGPHPPYYVPERYLNMYRLVTDPGPCPLPEGAGMQAPPSPENPSRDGVRLSRLRQAYWAAVTLIDAQIGRILDTLEETGQIDNTLILFLSDHGEMLGDRGAYQKHVPYEGSAHVPMIARGPGFGEGARCDVPVTTWDVSATILREAGVSPPADHPMIGDNLVDVCQGDANRTIVYHHTTGASRYIAAVGQGHKFVHWYNGGQEELYDLAADPWEQNNLLLGPSPRICGELRRRCQTFERGHGVIENVGADGFVDRPYEAPHPHRCSLYPLWAYRQFPHWMPGYSDRDLALIASEMQACAQDPAAYIPTDPEWRAGATEAWEAIGGKAAVYRALFDQIDAHNR